MGYEWKLNSLRLKMSGGPQSTRISPRKFSEKIALLNKKEREANAKFEQIINEVHSSIGQPQQTHNSHRHHQQPPADSSQFGRQLSTEELQAMIESTRYQAAHSDSLEEIERVYENLMRSVGQCELPPAANMNQQQQFAARAAANSDHSIPDSISTTSNPLIATNAPFYPQQQHQPAPNNHFRITNFDLNNNNHNDNPLSQAPRGTQSINYNIACGPVKSSARPSQLGVANKNLFSAHNVLDACVSSSYLPHAIHQQQDICMSDGQTRARVVSFGSASSERYRGATIAQHHQLGAEQQADECGARHQVGPQQQQQTQQQTQYLEEPTSDRCRQKSCSEPQLNVLAPAQALYSIGPIDQCKSDNRLAISSAQHAPAGHTTSPFDCCSHTASGPFHAPRAAAQQNSNSEYFPANTKAIDSSRQSAQVSTTSGIHFDLCDTTNLGAGELPGIKICTIGDTGQQYAASNNHRQLFANGEAQSRDNSLPDISNLQFGSSSAGTSPEKHQHYQPLDNWPPQGPADGQCCPVQLDGARIRANSGEASNGSSWRQYDAGQPEVKMEVQTGEQPMPVSSTQPQETACCWTSQTDQQHALKAANALSSSDYGFNTTSGSHHQQGNLMICTSSELYNNIFRSRSHSNIDYLAKQAAGSKRPHLCAQNLPHFEEHHTSQYCLQTSEQPAMNVRRIAELKAQGTSTSPLNSSSNLNSPQSDVNSPGSSTTEQCEPAIMFSNPAGQRDFYQVAAMPGEASSQFVQYAPASTTMRDIQQQQRPEPDPASEGASQQCVQIISQQSAMNERYIEQPAEHQLCQPSTTSRRRLFEGASPSSTTAGSLNYINNER